MIYPLSETKVLMGPITFEQAVGLMQPGDTFELIFQKKVTKYGFTVFKPGKTYKGSKVLSDGRIRVKHEDVFTRGTTSIFTKEEFLDELKSEGEPCNLLDCNKSMFIRPGAHGGQKTFAAALQNPSFANTGDGAVTATGGMTPDQTASVEPATSQSGEPIKDTGDDHHTQLSQEDPNTNPPGEPGTDIYIKPTTPNLKIERTQDGQYTISYGNISKKPIEGELQRLFGYANWEDYKRDNFEDLTKARKKDSKGNIISAPTVQPFHVAYALEEFIQNFKISDYELIAIPKGQAPDGGEDPNDRVLISIVSSLRKGFFGTNIGQDPLAGAGILNMAMYNPREGLVNKEIIDRIKEASNLKEKIQGLVNGAMFVKHPNGNYWRRDLQSPYVTNTRGEALIVKPVDSAANMSILNESLIGSPAIFIESVGLFTRLARGARHLWRYRGDWQGRALRRGAQRAAANRQAREAAEEAAEAARRWRRMSAGEKFKHVGGKVLDKAGAPFKAAGEAIPGGGLLLPIAGWMGGEYVVEKYGEHAWNWITSTFGFDPSDPETADRVLDQLDNLSPEEMSQIINTLPVDIGQIEISSVNDLEYYLLPVGWKGGGFLTKTEETLAKRIGANYSSGFMVSPGGKSTVLDFKKAFKKLSSAPAKSLPKTPKPVDQKSTDLKVPPTNILIFGHSQAGKYGRSLGNQAKESGVKVTKVIRSGHSDGASKKGLDKKLSDIPEKDFSHAFLFLGGNTGASGPDYQEAKKTIIDYMTGTLNIPLENLMVILPPVNLDNKYSKSRLALNKRAESYFNSLGVKVLPQVTGNKDDFTSDGVHIASNSKLAKSATGDMLNSFSVSQTTTDGAPISIGGGAPRPVDKSKQQVAHIVVDEAKKAGVDPLFALTVARIESGLNPLSNINKDSKYKGLYQFGSQYRDEWQRKYGLEWEKVHDARVSAAAFMKVIKEKVSTLKSRGVLQNSTPLNLDPNEYHLIYLAWQQGTHGTSEIVKAARAGSSVSKQIQRNMDNNTYPKTPNISPTAFLEMWRKKMISFGGRVQRDYGHVLAGQNIPAIAAAAAPTATKGEVAPWLSSLFGSTDDTSGAASITTINTGELSEEAKANNLRYFGNEDGNSGKGFKSSKIFKGAYNYSLNNTVGSIPFTGDKKISTKWKAENLIVADIPVPNILGGGPPKINKHLVGSLAAAVKESQGKYGLPLTHVGGFNSKGKASRFSSHAWGAAVDFDSVVGPFTVDGLMSRYSIAAAIKNKKGYYQRYWNFKNAAGQTYLDHLKESYANKTNALPLYVFVAGPEENNGIANIFEKHGWRWGGRWNSRKKDGMHFEYLPDKVKLPPEAIAESSKKYKNILLELIREVKDELENQ